MEASSESNDAILIIEPSQVVRFRGPFNRPVLSTISLINPSDSKIVYKIKTSAPAFYGVRPNFGVVQPRNFVEVEIARQPFNFDPKERIRPAHRFMIQSCAMPSEYENTNKFWRTADPDLMVSQKLRCVFELPPEHHLINSSDGEVSKTESTLIDEMDESRVVLLRKQIDALNSELRLLRAENSALNKENILLRSDIMVLRNLAKKDERKKSLMLLKQQRSKVRPLLYCILSSVTVVVACAFVGQFYLDF